MKSPNGTTTKEQILDVAERHFALNGFAGTSLRGIIKDAGVNVAAVAYHYGTKEELFDAVIGRFARPVISEQLSALEQIKAPAPDKLGSVLVCFYLPPLKAVKERGKSGEFLSLFLGRIHTEPDPIYALVDKHHTVYRTRFIDAFRQCLPSASEEELQWNFEFMLGLLCYFLTRQSTIRQRYGETADWTADQAADRMVTFCQSGMLGK